MIGHSYEALTALFLAAKHPKLVRAMVLAEPPAVFLLAPAGRRGEDRQGLVRRHPTKNGGADAAGVSPMQQAFRKGNREGGVAAFLDYVFNELHAWDNFSGSSRQETLRDAHEWDVMMTDGTLFPEIQPERIRKIRVPVLLLSGAKSYPFLALIPEELARLLPNHKNVVFPDAGHQMWYQHPEECRSDVEEFLYHAGIQ